MQSRNTRLAQAGEYVFFRVVDAYPGRRKRLRTDLMKSIASSQLAVTVHDVVNCDADVRVVTVSLQPKGSDADTSVSRLFDGTHDTNEILKWDTADDLAWLWRGHDDEAWLNSGLVPAALSRLFAAKAWQGVGHLAVAEQERDLRVALQALQAAGLVTCECSEGEGVHEQWRLCDHARASLYTGARLQNATVAMQIREAQPILSMTTWELVHSLLRDVARNAPKKFYCVGQKWCRAYLQVLLSRKQLSENGISTVPHGHTAAFYKGILESAGVVKASSRRSRFNFADEDGLAPVHAAPVRARRPRGGVLGARPRPPPEAGADGQVEEGHSEGGAPEVPVPEEAAARRGRARHAKSHFWPHSTGPCSLIFKPPRSWQATCPRTCSHRNPANPATKCTRTMSYDLRDADSEQEVLRSLRFWLSRCMDFSTRTQHMGFDPRLEELPADDVLVANAQRALPVDYNSDPEVPRGRRRRAAKSASKACPKPSQHPGRNRRREPASGAASSRATENPRGCSQLIVWTSASVFEIFAMVSTWALGSGGMFFFCLC